MRLEEKRIYLRPLLPEDASQQYVDWINDKEINRYLETRHSEQTVESCIEFIDLMNKDKNSYLFGVFLKENSAHIGNCKLGFINPHHLSGQLSLFIGERGYWGQGYAKEIIHALTKFGFRTLNLERIEAGCYEDNIGSLRAFIRCGYTVEGFFRKNVISDGRRCGSFHLGILKDEYK